jgi:hypothetical protein
MSTATMSCSLLRASKKSDDDAGLLLSAQQIHNKAQKQARCRGVA